ncbi:hypothetical protein GCM10009547_29560 [Sporichthya brevicatena]|uniref:AbiEi antitoxin C-terminal domain-containing protein n=1 Tax=Sporichthya brevicatena TaxID=171442 RepID=A0ABN1GZF2_9ACTN
MPPRPFVPPELTVGPFHQNTAFAAGLTRHQLASKCWVRLFRSVYVHHLVELTDELRFEALRLAAPADAVATGLTAAWLFGVWTPPPGETVPLHLALPNRGEYREAGVRTSRLVVDEGDIGTWHGVPVTNPERTCFGLMTRSSRMEATVWADAFLYRGLVTKHGLNRYADERPHWPYVRRVRAALELARTRARSMMESRLRLVIVYRGVDEPPLLNEPIYGPDGELLGIPDMGYPVRVPFGLEYDGEQHREPDHHAADLVRENRLLVVGNYPLLRYGALDVYRYADRTAAQVAAMLRRCS